MLLLVVLLPFPLLVSNFPLSVTKSLSFPDSLRIEPATLFREPQGEDSKLPGAPAASFRSFRASESTRGAVTGKSLLNILLKPKLAFNQHNGSYMAMGQQPMPPFWGG